MCREYGENVRYSEDGYIQLRKFPVDGSPALNVLLDAQGQEVTLPVETYRSDDNTYTELTGCDDGWLRFETYHGETDKNGNPVYMTRLVNWEGESLTFPTTRRSQKAANGMYTSGTWGEEDAYFVLIPAEHDTSAPPAVTLGDLDSSGAIDIMDVIKINKYLLGSVTLTENERAAAYVDGSGVIDATDSLNILKYVVKLITAFDAV